MDSFYFHIPFCRAKCPYCDFFSVVPRGEALGRYEKLLIRHLEFEAKRQSSTSFLKTVFFGGGTPSLLGPDQVARLLETVSRLFSLDSDAEISLEANPGTVSAQSLAAYRRAGVNRLSLGIQSMNAAALQTLGRVHSVEQARQAVEWGRAAGFKSLGADLMFALPGQLQEGLEQDVNAILALEPDHLSVYGLTIEEGTGFAERYADGADELPGEDTYVRMYRFLHSHLEARGYEHYEISNYARPGHRCRHNMTYWQRRPYLGIGAGAHSFIDDRFGVRKSVPGDLNLYVAALDRHQDPSRVIETFDRQGAMGETMYLGLRTSEGVDPKGFENRFGRRIEEVFPLASRRLHPYLRCEPQRWSFDLEGWLLFDHLIQEFL